MAQDTNCMVLFTPPPHFSHPPPSCRLWWLAATQGSSSRERAEPQHPAANFLTLGVAEVLQRGSRVRSAEQRCRLP